MAVTRNSSSTHPRCEMGRVDLDIGVQGELAPEIRVRKLFDGQRMVLLKGRHQRLKLTLEALARKHTSTLSSQPSARIARRGAGATWSVAVA